MTTKERTRHEISEAFDFLRFLIRHPKEIKRITNGSEINILCKDIPVKSVGKRKITPPQINYMSEHSFHRI